MQIKLQIIFTIFIFNCVVVQLTAQNQYNSNKNDYIWMVGYLSPNPDSLYGGAIIDFHNNPTKAYRKNTNIEIDQTFVSYSNNNGNLILMSNGKEVTDSTFNIMQNGTDFEVGLTGYSGNAGNQTTLVLDWPNDSNKIAIVYVDTHYDEFKYVNSHNLFYSVVDRKGNKGLGKVIEKNNKVFTHIMSPSQLTACRHANGRDWWIVKNSVFTDTIFKFLLTNKGVEYFGYQKVSNDKYKNGLGQSIFSPNGEMYASFHGVTINATSRFVLTYDFDRCSGNFSNRKYLYVDTTRAWCGGAAISPNSRYLYVAFTNFVFQYDLFANNIEATKDTVLVRDFTKNPGSSAFFQAQLAPDGKIYISTQNTTTYYHVINFPDKKGDSCMAVQAGFDVKTLYRTTVPNNPNYRLGRLIGSPCDTVHVANKEITTDYFDIKLFPNPASTDIKIDITLKEYDPAIKTEVVFIDINGAIVQKYTMPDFVYIATIDISKLARGVYGVQLRQPKRFGERVLAVEKLVVVR